MQGRRCPHRDICCCRCMYINLMLGGKLGESFASPTHPSLAAGEVKANEYDVVNSGATVTTTVADGPADACEGERGPQFRHHVSGCQIAFL